MGQPAEEGDRHPAQAKGTSTFHILGLLSGAAESDGRFNGLILFPQHFISQREEFETARDSILVWLTEMDLQLTNIEHFSECDVQAKIKQLRVRLPQL